MGKKKDLIEETSTAKVCEFDIEEIKMKKKRWYIKMWVDGILDRTYYTYHCEMTFDQSPYEDRIADMTDELDASLFADDKAYKKMLNESIKQVREERDRLEKDCRPIKFSAQVEEIKNKDKGTMLLMRVPDDIISDLNEQKSRFNYYLIQLDPSFV